VLVTFVYLFDVLMLFPEHPVCNTITVSKLFGDIWDILFNVWCTLKIKNGCRSSNDNIM